MAALTPKVIAKATNSQVANVTTAWNFLLPELGLSSIASMVGLAATIGVECHFVPIAEQGNSDYFKHTYGNRPDYEVDSNGLWKWRGRGYIQITGKDNYTAYSTSLGIDLVSNPDLALDPRIAARIAVRFYNLHGCNVWASRGHWLKVRELVNGKPKTGLPNGWTVFIQYVWNLLTAAYS